MNVLLSVKPKYANEIISGRKKYEFRKSIFKREDIKKMYIYSSSPVKKIIAIWKVSIHREHSFVILVSIHREQINKPSKCHLELA
jgi:predicted transcriptional regulator